MSEDELSFGAELSFGIWSLRDFSPMPISRASAAKATTSHPLHVNDPQSTRRSERPHGALKRFERAGGHPRQLAEAA